MLPKEVPLSQHHIFHAILLAPLAQIRHMLLQGTQQDFLILNEFDVMVIEGLLAMCSLTLKFFFYMHTDQKKLAFWCFAMGNVISI